MFTPLTHRAQQIIKELSVSTNSWWQLQSFYVEQKMRGRGFGKILLLDALDRSQKMGMSLILRAHPYNNSSMNLNDLIKFYEKQGLSRIKLKCKTAWLYKTFV